MYYLPYIFNIRLLVPYGFHRDYRIALQQCTADCQGYILLVLTKFYLWFFMLPHVTERQFKIRSLFCVENCDSPEIYIFHGNHMQLIVLTIIVRKE